MNIVTQQSQTINRRQTVLPLVSERYTVPFLFIIMLKAYKLRAFLICLISIYSQALLAGSNDPIGARSAGIGHASVTLTDEWSSFNNQAGLGFLSKPTIGAYFENRFQVKEFSMKAGTFAYPLAPATLAISYRHFGYSKYHESKLGLAVGKKFTNHFAIGVQIDYLQTYFAEGYGTYNAVAAEAGILAKPLKNLSLGFHVYNFTGNNNNSLPEESIPTNIRLGISYEIKEKVLLLLETEKELNSDIMVKAGLELKPIDPLFFRIGFATLIEQYSIGIGYKLKKISADLAFSHNTMLGFSPKAGISFEF
jgi:hypothetical protein